MAFNGTATFFFSKAKLEIVISLSKIVMATISSTGPKKALEPKDQNVMTKTSLNHEHEKMWNDKT